MSKKFSRNVSPNEVLSIAFDRIFSFNNQFILEGNGVLDKVKWEAAVETASAANPGSRLILKCFPGSYKWVDSGITPRVREVDGSKWSGYGPEGAPFLEDQLSPVTGPTCEVVLVHGNPLRVIFRTNHGIMDARATLYWAEDIFHALRGEPVLGSDWTLNDVEFSKTLEEKEKIKVPNNNLAPTGKAEGDDKGGVWLRKSIKGNYKNLQSQISWLLAHEAWKHSDGTVVICVSIDLRRHMPADVRAVGFLSRALFVEIKPEYTIEQISELVKKQLNEKREVIPFRMGKALFFIPINCVKYVMRSLSKKMHSSGRYSYSGLVATVGVLPLDKFTGGGFNPTLFYAVPPNIDMVPCFVGLVGNANGVEVMITMPKVLASNGRIEAIMENITSKLISK
jgi:hypothetical protein